MHRPISLEGVGLSFPNKTCFEGFSAQIYPGSRIAIIGRNGSGKSSLLNILRKKLPPSDGEVILPDNICIGYVEQTIDDFEDLSGGQRLNKRLSEALSQEPDILLLDEPTNHLDKDNRTSLKRKLRQFAGTLIVVSHDTELLRECVDTLWHVDNNKIHSFTCSYDDYVRIIKQKRSSIEKSLDSLKRDKKNTHHSLMGEQNRAAKSKAKGKKSIIQRKWPTITSNAKAQRSEQTSGKKKSAITKKKQQLSEQLSDLCLPEVILPKFSLTADRINTNILLSICRADVSHTTDRLTLKDVNLSLGGAERIAICGRNASGKSTLLKAILDKDKYLTTGSWSLPNQAYIGYLDQHYSNLQPTLSVIEHIEKIRPEWSGADAHRHLNDFLFRKQADILQLAENLSGGEKARLSLSIIAAKTPKLLILDEITNNLDLETKEHVIQVIKEYPGAIIVVSHEEDFLLSIGIDQLYTIAEGKLSPN